MVAANGVTARFLADAPLAVGATRAARAEALEPHRRHRSRAGETLPAEPDARALDAFLARAARPIPIAFPDLSLAIVKLLGAGEYDVDRPGRDGRGTLRAGRPRLCAFDRAESPLPRSAYPAPVEGGSGRRPIALLDRGTADAGAHCTEQENAADKVERQVRKSAAALLLSKRVGETFDGIVTGASDKGTWVRVMTPPVEGRVIRNDAGLDVGDRVRVQLVGSNVERGFIDFARSRGLSRASARTADLVGTTSPSAELAGTTFDYTLTLLPTVDGGVG